jgi:membrane protease YdiL (CAAX protease family)
VCHDIGWTRESFLKNVGIGIATYAAWLPMVLVGIFSVFVLMMMFPLSADVGEFELPASPSHPIMHLMMSGDSVMWIGVFLAACVAAPIVEETMFRGVLYRHLRERGIQWQRVTSVAVAAIVNGVIFAAIHPQGVLAIPLLTTLAIGFTLAREWRGSLVSSITMHALNNSMVTAVMFFLI